MISAVQIKRENHFKSTAFGRRSFSGFLYGYDRKWINKISRLTVLSVFALITFAHDINAADLQSEPYSLPALSEEVHGTAFAAPITDSPHKVSILVYGLSYHPDKQGVRRDKLDNERNWGLGVNYEFFEDTQGVVFAEAGVYRDSGSNMAKYAGAGYQFKFGKSWRIGAMLVGVQSKTYLEGRFFIAPIPVVTYDFGLVKLNAIYIPRYRDYNQFAAFGLMFSIPFSE